jgi:2-methylcitrate dehydratase
MAKAHAKSSPGVVENLAAWILAPRAQDIPQAAITQAKLLLLDTIGCGYAAMNEESSRAVLATYKDLGGAPQCTVIGSATKANAPTAVLVNGCLIRILDLNDYVNTKSGQIGGHPSDNIPVALAAGEVSGAAGREIMAAIVIGYEIYGRFKDAMDRNSGWDGVTVSGLVAPAMAGRLMRLDANKLCHALALSAARAVTPLAVRHGDISAAKSVANALVAQNGMQATMLAQHGVTGPLDLFENPHGLRTVFPATDGDALTAPLADDSYVMSCHIKAYPCLATGQAIVHAGLDLHRQIAGDVDKLAHVKVSLADAPFMRRQKDDPGRINPNSREAADHSFNFLAAVSMIDGVFGLAQFDNERWNDPKVRTLMGRLEIVCDPALNARAPGGFPCFIHANGKDGKDYTAEVPYAPGFSHRGIDEGAVVKKFNAVTAEHLNQTSRERIVEAAMALDDSPSCAALTAALAQAHPA